MKMATSTATITTVTTTTTSTASSTQPTMTTREQPSDMDLLNSFDETDCGRNTLTRLIEKDWTLSS